MAGEVSRRGGSLPPLEDRHTALAILLELMYPVFLVYRQVVAGEVSGRAGPLPPLEDRHTALAILLELAVQKVSCRYRF